VFKTRGIANFGTRYCFSASFQRGLYISCDNITDQKGLIENITAAHLVHLYTIYTVHVR